MIVAAKDRVLEEHETIVGIGELVREYGEDGIRMFASEEDQWIKLTGRAKEGNPIGPLPFKLLCSVSRSRTRGLTSVEISKETGQDPRSIYGRVNLLMDYGLVQRFPIVHDGMSTHLTVYKKYVDNNRQTSNPRGTVGIDLTQLRKAIIGSVQVAKNGLRQHEDLKLELDFDKNRRSQIIFASTIRDLEAQGYVQRVMVRRAGRHEKFRCIKFLKELPEHDDVDSCDESDNELFDEADEGVDNKEEGSNKNNSNSSKVKIKEEEEEEEEEMEVNTDKGDESTQLNANMIKVDDDEEDVTGSDKQVSSASAPQNCITFNQFYPLESQIYNKISQGGEYGVPAMDLCKKIVGSTYGRIFSRLLDCLVDRPPTKGSGSKKVKSGQPPHLEYLNIIRGIDFSARMKFYRYFTQVAYCAYVDKPPNEVWGSFKIPDLKGSSRTFAALEKSNKKKLPGLVEVLQDGDKLVPMFHGEKNKMSAGATVVSSNATKESNESPTPGYTLNGKKRGRPRKRPLPEETTPSAPEKKPRQENYNVQGQPGRLQETPTTSTHPQYDTALLQQVAPPISVDSSLPEHDMVADSLMAEAAAAAAAAAAVGENQQQTSNLAEPVTPIHPSSHHHDLVHSAPQTEQPNLVHFNIMPDTVENSSSIAAAALQDEEREQAQQQEQEQERSDTSRQTTPGPIYRSFPTNGLERKPRRTRRSAKRVKTEMSFAAIKRQNQIMEILEQENGITEGGVTLNKKISEQFPAGSTIDRKTINRYVENLVVEGRARQIFVTVPNARGVHITKYVLIGNNIDPESQEVEDAKNRLIQGVKKKPVPPVNGPSRIAVEENDFNYYFNTSRNYPTKSRKGGGNGKSSIKQQGVAMSRLARTDNERAKQKRAKEKESKPPKEKKKKSKKEKKEKTVEEEGNEKIKQNRGNRRKKANSSDPLIALSGQMTRKRSSANYTNPKSKKGLSDYKKDPITGKFRRDRQGPKQTGTFDPEIFYRVVVIVRALHYNPQGAVSWEKVVQYFPMINIEVAKSRWNRVRNMYGGHTHLVRATSRFESLLLKTYENGEIPIIEDEDEIDILFLASFWRSKDRDASETNTPWLYSTREEVNEEYLYMPNEEVDPMEALYTASSMSRYDDIITNRAFAYPLDDTDEVLSQYQEDVRHAKQSIKAIISTEDEVYNADNARKILDELGEAVCTEAVKQMEAEKSVMYLPKERDNFIPGRNFGFSDRFNSTFQTRYDSNVFDEATKFENSLVDAIIEKKGIIMSRTAPDSSLICILDFICHGWIDLVRINSMTGVLLREGYRSRTIDKDKLDCDLVLRGNEDQKLKYMVRPEVPYPLSKPGGNIWTDVNGNLSEKIWRKVLRYVLLTVALRPGITTQLIQKKLWNVITLEETRSMLDWLKEKQIISFGPHGGNWVQSRWYSYVY